jgi:hypothetical protein
MNYYNRGCGYMSKNNYAKALSFFKKETVLYKELYLNIGGCYKNLGEDQKAFDNYLLAADPAVPFYDGSFGPYDLALNNLGLMYYMTDRDDLAVEYYLRALEVNPKYHSCRWHLGISQYRQYLTTRDETLKSEATINYDFRFYQANNTTRVDTTLPRWDGVSKGTSVVVLAEQGIGDKFQWLRYARLLEHYFDKVWIQIPECLHELYSDYNVVVSVSETDATHCVPLCSLTRYFDIDDSPHNYLRRPEPHNFNTTKLKIGIVATGSPSHLNDKNRSCGIHHFLGLLDNDVVLYNLTPGARPVQGIESLDPKSWSETARYLCGLDLVISVDTSVVHLAGILGVPCWVLMPTKETDFRWGSAALGSTNPWWPTVKVFRNPGNFTQVFKVVKELLKNVKNN